MGALKTTTQQSNNKGYSDHQIARGEYDLSKVYDQYFPFVLSVCKRYYLRLYDTEDLHQEALIICFKSLHTYKLEYKISFSAFYKLNLERHFCSLLRHEKSQKRTIDSLSTSYEQIVEETSGEVGDERSIYSYDIESAFLSKIDLDYILAQLSDFEKEVLYLHLTTHKNADEIADELNVKIDKIYCTFYRIKKKLKDKLFE